MTDLSILSHIKASTASSSTEVISTALGQLGEVFSEWHEHTRTAPSLRQVGHDLLTQLLPESSVVKNPDVLFINTTSDDGSLARSVSLTDALLQTLTQGLAEFESGNVRVYSRHDSLDEQHHVSALEGKLVLEVLTSGLEALPRYYKDRIDAFWSESLPVAGQEESQTRDKTCVTLHQDILKREMELLFLNHQISEEDKATLVQSFSGSNLYRISLRNGTGSGIVTSAFVIPRTPQTRSPLTLANCEGNVFLVSATHGIELYESLTDLDQKLRARLSDAHEREYLLQDLLLRERAALQTDESSVIEPVYSYFADDLTQYRMIALRHKQIKDFDFTLDAAQQTRQMPADLLLAVDALSQLSYLDSAQRRHFHHLFSQVRQRATPHWFKDASEQDQAFYLRLAANYQKHADEADGLMGGLESIRAYALDKINAYVLNHLGYRIDPEQIFISILDEVALSGTISEPFTYRKSLLDFVVDGLPVVLEETIFTLEVPAQFKSPALDFPFVEKMIAELDVQQHFELDMHRRFFAEGTIRAIAHQRDSAIELSAWAAKLKSHLRDDKSQELIQCVRGDKQEPGTEFSMGGLAILEAGHVMKDVLVFRMKRDNETHYVLYAPGAPGDRDLFEFTNWQRLSIEVGGWLAKPEGAKYVINQVPVKSRAAVTSLIRSTVAKPSEWSESTVIFRPMAPLSYESNLIIQARDKVAQDLLETFIDIADQDLSQTYRERRKLALLDARISVLNERFNRDVQLRSYRDFVREKGSQWLAQYFRNKGIDMAVDPDTVWFNRKGQHDERNPFSPPPLEDVSLTSLLMNDFLDQTVLNAPVLDKYISAAIGQFIPGWPLVSHVFSSLHKWFVDAPKPLIYSSSGQDLSALGINGIYELLALPMGEDYISILEQRLSDPDENQIFYRRAVLAKRKYFEIHRDALSEKLKGRLSEEQYEWLSQLLRSVDSSPERRLAPANSSVNMLVFDNSTSLLLGKDGRVIEGAFTFTRLDYEDSEFRLIYTPDAPDGIRFRTHEQIISTMKNPGMPAYYYERASFKDQPAVGTMVQNLEQDPDKHQGSFSTRVSPIHRITDMEQLYEAMVQRMIEDIDEQTESAGERNAAIAYTVVKWTGTILFLPFPPVALLWGLAGTAVEFAQGYSAYRDGDRATALVFFYWGYIGLISAGFTTGDVVNHTTGKAWRLIRWASTDRLPFPVI